MIVGALVLVLIVIAVLGAVETKAPRLRYLNGGGKFTYASATNGCGGVVALANGDFRIPITFSRVGSAAVMSVNVCIDGRGPYPFLIDSGAAESTVALSLARTLDLMPNGRSVTVHVFGCRAVLQPDTVRTWSLSGLPLVPQALDSSALPGFGGAGEPMGLLGSDVMSRFGAVRFDFAAQTMTVPGAEGPPPATRAVLGPAGPPDSSGLVTDTVTSVVALSVSQTPNYTQAFTAVQFPGFNNTVEVVLDTGAARSDIAGLLIPYLGPTTTDLLVRVHTVCSEITIPLVRSRKWSLALVNYEDSSSHAQMALAPLLIGTKDPGLPWTQTVSSAFQVVEPGESGPPRTFRVPTVNGILGLDALSNFQYIVIDYAGAKLVLGPRDR